MLILNISAKPDWKAIQAELKKDGFVSTVLNFNKDKIKPACKNYINKHYLADESTYDIEKFYRASKAAGPLAEWAKSIIQYAEIFEKVGPLQQEVKDLEKEA